MAYALQSVLQNDYLNKSTIQNQAVNGAVTFQAVGGSVNFKCPTSFLTQPGISGTGVPINYNVDCGSVALIPSPIIPNPNPGPTQADFGALRNYIANSYYADCPLTNGPENSTKFQILEKIYSV
jgi:hypothetical protein